MYLLAMNYLQSLSIPKYKTKSQQIKKCICNKNSVSLLTFVLLGQLYELRRAVELLLVMQKAGFFKTVFVGVAIDSIHRKTRSCLSLPLLLSLSDFRNIFIQ